MTCHRVVSVCGIPFAQTKTKRKTKRRKSVDLSLSWFVSQLFGSPALFITIMLTLGVIFVNGWTDAPNAIATAIATRALKPRSAILLSAFFNFLGVLVMTMITPTVAMTIKNMVNFNGNNNEASIALCAALFAIIIWAVAAWYFGIPTSESHALIAGISGAAIALHNGFEGINGSEWVKVLYGLALSTVLGFCSGYVITRLIMILFRRADRRCANKGFGAAQIFGAAAMSFMHGAQDGQKFMGVMILGVFLANNSDTTGAVTIPIWMMVLCSAVMAVGTSAGGYKIIKAVGMDMVKLDKYQGFSADIAAAFCLLLSSVWGLPVSTTHTKTTAIMGVGATKRLSAIKGLGKKTAERIVLELKDKVSVVGAACEEPSQVINESIIDEATEALVALGINKNEAYRLARENSSNCETTEDIIRKAFQNLG